MFNRFPLFAYVFLGLVLLPACTTQSLLKVMTSSPDIRYEIPAGRRWNKYEKDALYLSALVKHAYPRLDQKMDSLRYTEASRTYLIRSQSVPNNAAFALETQRFLAGLRDGHTQVPLRFGDSPKQFFSLRLARIAEQLVLANIDAGVDSTWIGATILAINEVPIDTVQRRMLAFESAENPYWAFKSFVAKVQYPGYWEALGVLQGPRALSFSLLDKSGRSGQITLLPQAKFQVHTLPAGKRKYAFTRKQNNGFYTRILKTENAAYLQMNTCLDYVAIKSEINNYTNVLTRPIALSFLRKQTRDARNFGLVLEEFFTAIQQENIGNVILDLRYNSGGDERLGKQLIWYLSSRTDLVGFKTYYQVSDFFRQQVKVDHRKYQRAYRQQYGRDLPEGLLNVDSVLGSKPFFEDIDYPNSPFVLSRALPKFEGQVYVLVGEKTMSAAQVLATTLSDNHLATIVGTPTGNRPSTQTGASPFKLPHTKTLATMSYVFMERPNAAKSADDALYPDMLIPNTLEQAQNRRDEAFEYILQRIADTRH
ncbi:MAG: hypothetical protein IT260_07705 [Saprospiraceae bacterium]|nr:hypothetical protein [Saprospiraceae bacterium]